MFVVFEIYFPTFAQGAYFSGGAEPRRPRLTPPPAPAVASFSPTAMAASVLFSSLFSFVIIFNGVVQVRFCPGHGSAPAEWFLTVLSSLTAIRPTSVRARGVARWHDAATTDSLPPTAGTSGVRGCTGKLPHFARRKEPALTKSSPSNRSLTPFTYLSTPRKNLAQRGNTVLIGFASLQSKASSRMPSAVASCTARRTSSRSSTRPPARSASTGSSSTLRTLAATRRCSTTARAVSARTRAVTSTCRRST